jgi:uncharacterized protein YcbK (DUF882 family)
MTLPIIAIVGISLISLIAWILHKRSSKIAVLFIIGTLVVISGGYFKRNALFRSLKNKQIFPQTKSCAINSQVLHFTRDIYTLHRKAGAKLSEISTAESSKERDLFVQKGILLPLSNTKGYHVQKMNYGSPYVHKDMHARIEEIERRFSKKQKEKGISGVQFVITSAYRTTSDQKRLRKVNRSATNGISSHSYGASIDIAKLRGKHCRIATSLFAEVLVELQKEKKIYLCPESKTIHVTIRP